MESLPRTIPIRSIASLNHRFPKKDDLVKQLKSGGVRADVRQILLQAGGDRELMASVISEFPDADPARHEQFVQMGVQDPLLVQEMERLQIRLRDEDAREEHHYLKTVVNDINKELLNEEPSFQKNPPEYAGFAVLGSGMEHPTLLSHSALQNALGVNVVGVNVVGVNAGGVNAAPEIGVHPFVGKLKAAIDDGDAVQIAAACAEAASFLTSQRSSSKSDKKWAESVKSSVDSALVLLGSGDAMSLLMSDDDKMRILADFLQKLPNGHKEKLERFLAGPWNFLAKQDATHIRIMNRYCDLHRLIGKDVAEVLNDIDWGNPRASTPIRFMIRSGAYIILPEALKMGSQEENSRLWKSMLTQWFSGLVLSRCINNNDIQGITAYAELVIKLQDNPETRLRPKDAKSVLSHMHSAQTGLFFTNSSEYKRNVLGNPQLNDLFHRAKDSLKPQGQ